MDTSATLAIRISPWRVLLLAVGALAMATLSGLIAFGLIALDDTSDRLTVTALSGVGTLFFSLCAAMWLWRLVVLRGPVVILAPDGFSDLRVARGVIPWEAIGAVRTWQLQSQRFMILSLAPEIERGLALTPIARWTRGMNRRLGANGLAIASTGLKIGHGTLLAETTARVQAARNSKAPIAAGQGRIVGQG